MHRDWKEVKKGETQISWDNSKQRDQQQQRLKTRVLGDLRKSSQCGQREGSGEMQSELTSGLLYR